jgi:hypothetical protein
LEEYCLTLPKPKRDALPSLGYTIKAMGCFILVAVIRRMLFMPKKAQSTCITPPKVSQKYIGLHNIYFDMRRGIT